MSAAGFGPLLVGYDDVARAAVRLEGHAHRTPVLTSRTVDERTGASGVLAYSAGHHAQAVALAGRPLGVAATAVMPQGAPGVKLAATRGHGAEVIT